VNPGDPNVVRVEVVAEALGDLCDELVLVGGCAASLLIDAPSASPARVTYDVDVIAEVAALHGYHALERKFAGRGFSRDISAPAFLATKFEAFHTRGKNDVVMSHDLEDIVNVVEGGRLIVNVVAAADAGLRAYLAMRFDELGRHPDFENTLPGLVAYDELFQSRIAAVRHRISAIAGLEPQ
jgi:hypothetical protein